MQQYNKEQLTSMSLDELRAIATELDLKTSGQDAMDLVYAILDRSAMQTASDSAKNAATKRRTRVKTVDRVYSANKEKAKKIDKPVKREVDNTLFGTLTNEEKAHMAQAQEEERRTAQAHEEAEQEQTQGDTKAPKKRGRKPSTKNKPKDPVETAAAEELHTAPGAGKSEASAPKEEQRAADFNPDNMGISDFMVMDFSSNLPAAATVPAPRQEAPNPDAEVRDNASAHVSAPRAETPSTDEEESDFIILQDLPALDYMPQRQPEEYYEPTAYSRHAEAPRAPRHAEYAAAETYPATEAAAPAGKAKSYDFSGLLKMSGVLETVDNYGFLRSSDYNYLASPDDIYLTQMQIKHYGLTTGDVVECFVRPPRPNEKYYTMSEVVRINGCDPQTIRDRVAFEYLTPLFPDEKYKLCQGDGSDSQSCRIVDLFTPIGKGQRALIVAQPKTGKTMLMKDIANAIARNHPEAYLIMLLIDERPEEVTDMSRTVNAEVIASTFDAPAENHVKIAGLVLEKAKRMVECGQDVVIFLDSITRLARAYNTVSPGSGKVLTGGVDANALQRPKRFFGAARNIEGGGSLTIVATALIDTGSKMDEVIFEEFKGTGNMELQLDRNLSNKRIFPAVNLVASSTRRDDLLQDQTTINRMRILRDHIADMTPREAMDLMKNYMEKTKNNEEFLITMNG